MTYCHKGVRSMKALEILRGAGFGKVRSLAGGIDAWASGSSRGWRGTETVRRADGQA